jgi:hypothetical protein
MRVFLQRLKAPGCSHTGEHVSFDGTVQGTIEGELNLGEYGTARWTARRADQASA